MIVPDISSFGIGAFTLKIGDKEQFAVVRFQMDKSVGTVGTCTATIADCTQMVSINNSNYPKKMGSIKQLFKQVTKIENIGTLPQVSLIEYSIKGKKVWFTGRLCTTTPMLDASYGVSAGLQCFCLGKACQLLYSPIADFIYVSKQTAMNPETLKAAGVFDKTILQDTFSASGKTLLNAIIAKISSKDTILQMLNKAMNAVMQKNATRGKDLGGMKIDLTEYFKCDLKLSQALSVVSQKGAHPYVKDLITDLYNGLMSADILSSVTNALMSKQRFLTFIPSTIKEAEKGEDKLKIWPNYLEPQNKSKSILLNLDDMLSCTVSANPLMHLKTPTVLYVKPAKMNIWDPQQKTKQDLSSLSALGKYQLPGAKPPYRVQVLDVPSWVLSSVQEIAKRYADKKSGNKNSQLLNPTLQEFFARLRQEQNQGQQKAPSTGSIKAQQAILNQMAKTKFYNTYMLAKSADINLAVNQRTLNMDQYIGRSISLITPVQASQLGVTGQSFYGKVQSVKYSFTAASSPRAKSQFSISCTLSGVTAAESPVAQIFQADDPFFMYKRG